MRVNRSPTLQPGHQNARLGDRDRSEQPPAELHGSQACAPFEMCQMLETRGRAEKCSPPDAATCPSSSTHVCEPVRMHPHAHRPMWTHWLGLHLGPGEDGEGLCIWQVRREGLSGFSHNSLTLPPCQVPGRLSDISLESCGLRGPCPPQMSRRKDTGKLFQNQFRLYKPLGASKPDSGRCPYGHTPRVKTGCLKHLIPRSHHLLELSLQMPPSLALGSEQCRMSPS